MSTYTRVTTVLAPWEDFSHIPALVLEAAQERGNRVHAAMAAHAQGLWVSGITEDIQGYVDSGRRWFDKYVRDVLAVEIELTDDELMIVGHPDLLCKLRTGEGAVVDWKTPQTLSRTWPAQTAAYKRLAEVNGIEIDRRMATMLDPAGGIPRVIPYTEHDRDWTGFQNALYAHRYFVGGR